MFDGLEADLALELVESRAFEGGAVALRYGVVEVKAGDPAEARWAIIRLPECASCIASTSGEPRRSPEPDGIAGRDPRSTPPAPGTPHHRCPSRPRDESAGARWLCLLAREDDIERLDAERAPLPVGVIHDPDRGPDSLGGRAEPRAPQSQAGERARPRGRRGHRRNESSVGAEGRPCLLGARRERRGVAQHAVEGAGRPGRYDAPGDASSASSAASTTERSGSRRAGSMSGSSVRRCLRGCGTHEGGPTISPSGAPSASARAGTAGSPRRRSAAVAPPSCAASRSPR